MDELEEEFKDQKKQEEDSESYDFESSNNKSKKEPSVSEAQDSQWGKDMTSDVEIKPEENSNSEYEPSSSYKQSESRVEEQSAAQDKSEDLNEMSQTEQKEAESFNSDDYDFSSSHKQTTNREAEMTIEDQTDPANSEYKDEFTHTNNKKDEEKSESEYRDEFTNTLGKDDQKSESEYKDEFIASSVGNIEEDSSLREENVRSSIEKSKSILSKNKSDSISELLSESIRTDPKVREDKISEKSKESSSEKDKEVSESENYKFSEFSVTPKNNNSAFKPSKISVQTDDNIDELLDEDSKQQSSNSRYDDFESEVVLSENKSPKAANMREISSENTYRFDSKVKDSNLGSSQEINKLVSSVETGRVAETKPEGKKKTSFKDFKQKKLNQSMERAAAPGDMFVDIKGQLYPVVVNMPKNIRQVKGINPLYMDKGEDLLVQREIRGKPRRFEDKLYKFKVADIFLYGGRSVKP